MNTFRIQRLRYQASRRSLQAFLSFAAMFFLGALSFAMPTTWPVAMILCGLLAFLMLIVAVCFSIDAMDLSMSAEREEYWSRRF